MRRRGTKIHYTYPDWARSYARWTTLSAVAPFATLFSLVCAVAALIFAVHFHFGWEYAVILSVIAYGVGAFLSTAFALLLVIKPKRFYVLYALELDQVRAAIDMGLERDDARRTQPFVAPFTFFAWLIFWVIPGAAVGLLCWVDGLGGTLDEHDD